jgi:hypothetical protein
MFKASSVTPQTLFQGGVSAFSDGSMRKDGVFTQNSEDAQFLREGFHSDIAFDIVVASVGMGIALA